MKKDYRVIRINVTFRLKELFENVITLTSDEPIVLKM